MYGDDISKVFTTPNQGQNYPLVRTLVKIRVV